ncbi:hypothetical protein AYO49_02330 [Verrucomicrobiaceae bacterium SCGC AG-212-N21]|nr:hypothetical protein AYO49_02330 [Verrucomicrobiaceae bacterium SCGC AG-212-N21]
MEYAVQIPATIVRGHRVASGEKADPRFPGGTIRMQAPYFRERGLDLAPYQSATLNVSIAPWQYRVVHPRYTFKAVKWHPTEPAEDFSFFDVRLQVQDETREAVTGLIYFPHPETKPEHFQSPDVLELLLPWMVGMEYGMRVLLEVPEEQMTFVS